MFTTAFKFKTEMHAHTKPVSLCSEVEPEKLIELYKKQNADAVVITNHFSPFYFKNGTKEEKLKEYISEFEAARKLGDKNGINIILGIEIRFTENANDYLVYGVSFGDIEKMIRLIPYGITEFYKEIKTRENIILQAHPFRNGMTLAPLDSIDGIETFNMHPGHNSRVAVACRYAAEHSLLVSGGTDYHHPGHHAMCLMRTNERVDDSYDIARILKTKDFLFDLSGALVIPRI